MRRIVAFNRVTAEGYFSTPDGNLDWVVPDDEIDNGATEGMPLTDTVLFGRRTYQMFESFWPHVLDNPDASDPHTPGRRSSELQAMAAWFNEANKVVFSRTLDEVTWKNAHLRRELDRSAVEAMKREPGKDMMIFGSGTVASQLTEHGLIDEYQFVVSPILLGNGKVFISGVQRRVPLKLLEVKPFRSGNVKLTYVPAT